jgi:hypothetical protein
MKERASLEVLSVFEDARRAARRAAGSLGAGNGVPLECALLAIAERSVLRTGTSRGVSDSLCKIRLCARERCCGLSNRTSAWSMAGIFGPVLVNYIREYNVTHGVAPTSSSSGDLYLSHTLRGPPP